MSFNFPLKDNIFCNNHEIEMTEDDAMNASFLVCCEWRNTLVKFTIVYLDKTSQTIQFNVNDLSYEPVYDESISFISKTKRYQDFLKITVQNKLLL